MWPVLILSSATLIAGVLYLRRGRELNRFAKVPMADAAPDVRCAVELIVAHRIQHGLPRQGLGKGFASFPVAYREPQDTYDNCQELLSKIAMSSSADKVRDLLVLIRMMYQFAYSLDSLTSETSAAIAEVERRLMRTTDGGTIDRLERAETGAPLDQRTMAPSNFGTHVEASFGPVAISTEGKVLHKAKVYCK